MRNYLQVVARRIRRAGTRRRRERDLSRAQPDGRRRTYADADPDRGARPDHVADRR